MREVAQFLRCSKTHVAHLLNGQVPGFPRSVQTRGGEWQDRVSMMAWFIEEMTVRCGGCATGTKMVAAAWNQQTRRTGMTPSANCESVSPHAMTTPLQFSAGVSRLRL